MGLLEDTGGYPAVGPSGEPPGLDPFKGYVLGERPVLRPDLDPPGGQGVVVIRRDRCLGGMTLEQPAIEEEPPVPRWRRAAVFIINTFDRVADSRVISSVERAIFRKRRQA